MGFANIFFSPGAQPAGTPLGYILFATTHKTRIRARLCYQNIPSNGSRSALPQPPSDKQSQQRSGNVFIFGS